jgi:virginiamycin B lyase
MALRFGTKLSAGGFLAASLACAGALLVILLFGTTSAAAAIYWGNGTPVGRSNNDGTEAQDEFIKYAPFTLGGSSMVRVCGGVAVDDGHVYWAEPASGTIGRANLDGSSPDYGFIVGASNPCGVVVNSNHIYWTNFSGNSIGRANLDGSSVSQSFINAVSDPCGLAADSKFIYWTSSALHYVGRALIETGDKGPPVVEEHQDFDFCGLAVGGGHLFWGGFGNQIGRVNVDGSEAEPSYLTGINGACGIVVHGDHVYWSEQQAGDIGVASINGGVPSGRIVGGLARPCGVAVDDQLVSRPHISGLSQFRVGKARRGKQGGIAFLPVDLSEGGYLGVKATAGLDWMLFPDRLRRGAVSGGGRHWLKIWPGKKGGNGRRLRRQIKERGRTTVVVEVEYAATAQTPRTISKRIVLRKSR